jgi:hypothetical protein
VLVQRDARVGSEALLGVGARQNGFDQPVAQRDGMVNEDRARRLDRYDPAREEKGGNREELEHKSRRIAGARMIKFHVLFAVIFRPEPALLRASKQEPK